MKANTESRLKIRVKDEDATNLKSAIKKIVEEESKAGFKKNLFTDDEMKVIKSLHEKIKE